MFWKKTPDPERKPKDVEAYKIGRVEPGFNLCESKAPRLEQRETWGTLAIPVQRNYFLFRALTC